MLGLPSDNPFSFAVRVLVILAMFKLTFLVILSIIIRQFTRRLYESERRQERILTVIEAWAKLGKDRREEATKIKDEVKQVVTVATEEVKATVDNVPNVTAAKVMEALDTSASQSGMRIPKPDNL